MSDSKPSLQDIIKKRRSSDFVGRDRELGWFRRNLNLTPDDPERKFIVSISGQGGMGKTYLQKRFRVLAEEAGVLTAWTDDLEKEIPTVLGKLAADLEAIGHPLKKFAERYKVYRTKKQEVEADPQAPQGFAGFLGCAIAKGTLSMAKRIPIGGAIADMVDEKGFEDQVGEFATFVARKLTNKDEVQLVLEPVDVLTPIFLEDLFELAEKQSIVLFFDTYEATCDFLDPWLRNMLNGRYGNLPANFLLAIAGRNPLNENWMELNAIIEPFLLEPLSETDARAYLNQHQITDEATVSVILNLTNRIPLWLATLTAQSPEDPSKVGDPAGEAVTRYLCWVENDLQRQTVLDMAFPLSWNQDLVAFLVGDNKAPEIFSWLQKQPFVTKRNQAWEYHVVVRNQLLRYQQQQSPQHWTELHSKLADFFQQNQEQLGFDIKAGLEDTQWKESILANIYHHLCSDPIGNMILALEGYLKALKFKKDFALTWSYTMYRAGEDVQNSIIKKWGNDLQTILQEDYNDSAYLKSIEVFSQLIDEKKISSESLAIAYNERAKNHFYLNHYNETISDLNCAIALDNKYTIAIANRGATYYQLKEHDKALADFNRALELDEKDAWAIAKRGQTYHTLKLYDEALTDFNHAIELDKKVAWYFVERGETYRLMERYEEALTDFNRAIELDEKYSWAIAMRGQINQALKRYNEALTDFNHVIQLDEKVALYFAGRGEIYRLMERYEEALADFDRAIELDEKYSWAIVKRGQSYQTLKRYEEALTDFNRAIELNEKYSWAIAKRGQTYQELKRYDEALTDFTRAIELDEKYSWAIASRGQTYQTLKRYDEALADFNRAIELNEKVALYFAERGETYRLMERYEEALTDFNRAIELDEKYSWAIARRGQTYQELKRYDEALTDFTRAIELDEKETSYIAERGETYRSMKRNDEALTDFNRAIELDKKYSWAIVRRGETYGSLKCYDKALADFTHAIELDEKDTLAIGSRGAIYVLMKCYDKALADFTHIIEIDEKDALAIACRGEIYRLMKLYDEALTDFNHAIELDEKYSWAIASRGQTFQALKRFDEALTDFTQAIELNGDEDFYYYLRSLINLHFNQDELFHFDLSQAIQLSGSKFSENPQDWRISFNLALYYLVDNQTEKSLDLYQKTANECTNIEFIKPAIDDLEELLFEFPAYIKGRTIIDYLNQQIESKQ
ncbi:tetratricopeptide repeat protein, partial [candidate division KSB1 bacterium]|nr:tetratricopeptide repeat protein [candidate division KSB1 bacterium]